MSGDGIPINSLPFASTPLTTEVVPVIQGGATKHAPASAFGIPIAATAAPTAVACYQLWWNTSTAPPTLAIFNGTIWIDLLTFATDGTVTLLFSPHLPGDPVTDDEPASKHYADHIISAAGGLIFKGTIDCSGNPNYPAADQGHLYQVSAAGLIGGASGLAVEIGDLLLCKVNGTGSGDQVTACANWTVVQVRLDRIVSGPVAGTTDGHIPLFDGATGRLLKDGLAVDTDTALTANSDTRVATQKAVKGYADALIAASDAMVFKGVVDCSGNPNYPAADRGHTYRVSVAGKLGGTPGVNVEAGDILLCLDDGTASGTQAGVGSHWNIIQTNIDGAVVGPASAVDGHVPKFSGSTGKVIADGYPLDTDGAMAANSDTSIASQKATKTYAGSAAAAAVAALGVLADTTWYVRTDGNDANTGLANTAGGAFLTLQHAVDVVGAINLNGHTATIQVADGTYAAGINRVAPFNNGNVIVQGNTATPGNCIISTSGTCISTVGVNATIQGFKLTSSAGGLISANASQLTLGAMEYGSASGTQISLINQAGVSLTANYTISGGGVLHGSANRASVISYPSAITVTLTGTPAFSTAFFQMLNGSVVDMAANPTFSGAATGNRYLITDTSGFRLNATTPDPEYIVPGDKAGNHASRVDGNRSYRNLLMNASGRLQKGPSGVVTDTNYGLHNRWYALTQTGAITPSTLLDDSDGVPYLMRLTNTLGSAQRLGYAQIIEGCNCKHLRGKHVTLSGLLRPSTNIAVRYAIIEWLGTEDAVTRDVVNDWTSATFTTGNFFASTNLTIAGNSSKSPGATVLLPFALSDIALSSAFNNLIVFVWSNSTLSANVGTLDFLFQLEHGARATNFERRPVSTEEMLCRRYYRSFTVQSENGSRNIPMEGMRAAPTMTVSVGSASAITADGFELTHTAAAACAVTASAEL